MGQNFLWFISLFALPFLVTLIATPLISRFALNFNIVDKPGYHKTHSKAKPLLGGISIFISFAAILYIFLPLDEKLVSLIIATVILVITGLLDDLYNIRPIYKLIGQTAAAAIVVLWNADLFIFMTDYFARFFLPGLVVLALIIGWIVLMVNAFNLIDGLDGLAAGTAAIIFIAMAALSVIEGGRPTLLGVQLIGAGACLGFLVFNFNPARIYMGDTGSMLLGFILATAHLYVIKYPFSLQLVLGSILLFAYPALDVTYAFYRRICNRCPVFQADRGHIHHVLLNLGFSVKQAVLIIYGVNFFFAILAVVLLSLDVTSPLLLAVLIVTLTGIAILYRYLFKLSEILGMNKVS